MKRIVSIFAIIVLTLVMSISVAAKFQNASLYYGGKYATCYLSGTLTSPVFTASMEATQPNSIDYYGDSYHVSITANYYDAYMGKYGNPIRVDNGINVKSTSYQVSANAHLLTNTAYNKYVWSSISATYEAYDNLNPSTYPYRLYMSDGF